MSPRLPRNSLVATGLDSGKSTIALFSATNFRELKKRYSAGEITTVMTDSPPSVLHDVRQIAVRRFKAGSMFKLVFAATAGVFVPLIVLCGVTAFFGAKTVTLSGQH